MSFFSERPPIPSEIVHEVNPDGTLGKEVKRVSRDGVVRELETAVYLDLGAVVQLRDWLDDRITTLEEAVAKREETEKMRASGKET